MPTKYVHTNIISKDWKRLSDFYIEVFECKIRPPKRELKGKWLELGSGVRNAQLEGVHLILPGYGEGGPTLEIFTYTTNLEKPLPPKANREGYGHLAFHVDDVEKTLEKIIKCGGSKIGDITTKEFPFGKLTFTYATDPDGNIIELQRWN